MPDPRNEFVPEAEDLIQEAESGLLELQGAGSGRPEVLNGVFRAMHTLKGSSGLFGLSGIAELSHALESILDDLRLGRRKPDEELFSFLFRHLDCLKELIREVSLNGREQSDVADRVAEIERFLQNGVIEPGERSLLDLGVPEDIARVLTEYEEHRVRTGLSAGHGLYVADVEFPLDSFEAGLEVVSEKIRADGELIATMPGAAAFDAGRLGFGLLFSAEAREEELAARIAASVRTIVAPAQEAGPAEEPAEEPEEHQAGAVAELKSFTNTVRVDVDKLDGILNTIGELLLAKSAVVRIGKELNEFPEVAEKSMDLQKVTRNLERRLAELRDQILEVRMIPIGQIFDRLARAVRRYSRETGVEVDLHTFGNETEIDKLMAEEVIDSLMHLIRNAVDHGIEPPDERREKGKDARGSVVLKAFPRGNHVIINVEDDGRGIDPEKVSAKARKAGILDEDVVPTVREAVNLIFTPGFSTKDEVSEVSGRGVGMDVVKEKIASLGGFVDVDTVVGQGTVFSVTLPITLAIIKALIIRVGQERYALPLSSISETLVVESAGIRRIEGKEAFELRGEMLPLLRLGEVFRLENVPRGSRVFVVVAGFGARRLGLVVDDLIGQQEVVIKNLGKRVEGARGIAGAAEIGKHEVILVIDVESLMDEAMLSRKAVRPV